MQVQIDIVSLKAVEHWTGAIGPVFALAYEFVQAAMENSSFLNTYAYIYSTRLEHS